MKRIPRPLGLTFQALTLSTNPSKQEKKKIQEQLIGQYVAQGTKFNGRNTTIQEFANFIGVSTIELLQMMTKEISRIDNFFASKNGNRNQSRALFLGLFFGAQEATEMARNQATILAKAQGQDYVPFLSSALNQSIANYSSSFKAPTELVKLLDGGSNNPSNTPGLTQNNHYHITPDKAFEIAQKAYQSTFEITQNGTENGTPKEPFLVAEIGAALEPDLPQVNAKFQDLSGIGIRTEIPSKSDTE